MYSKMKEEVCQINKKMRLLILEDKIAIKGYNLLGC